MFFLIQNIFIVPACHATWLPCYRLVLAARLMLSLSLVMYFVDRCMLCNVKGTDFGKVALTVVIIVAARRGSLFVRLDGYEF